MIENESIYLYAQPQTEEESIISTIQALWADALREESIFKTNYEYKWEIGAKIYKKIVPEYWSNSDEKQKLCGWPININFGEENIIKLWRSPKT